MPLLVRSAAEQPGQHEEDQHDHEEHEGGGEGQLHDDRLGLEDVLVEHQGQRALGAVERVEFMLLLPKAVKISGAVSPAAMATPSTHGGDEAGARRGQHDLAHGPPLGGTEGERRLAKSSRHDPEHLLGRPGDGREHEHEERHGGGETRVPDHVGHDEDGVDEDAGHDGRDAAHGGDDGPDEARPPPADLVEEDGGEEGQRHGHEGGQADLLERPDDGVADADVAEEMRVGRLVEPPWSATGSRR